MPDIIFYRNKCIGCGICFEQQPNLWRMSNKDGKATLVNSIVRKELFVLRISNIIKQQTELVLEACTVKIITIS